MPDNTPLTPSVLAIVCFAVYVLSTLLLWRRTQTKLIDDNAPIAPLSNASPTNPSTLPISLIALVATALHATLLYRSLFGTGEPIISLGLAVSIAGWISAVLFLILSIHIKILELGLVLLPVAAVALILGSLIPGEPVAVAQLPDGIIWHMALAVPTYGVLCAAFAQACLLIFQDRQLHNHGSTVRLTGLPALQSMDTSLLWLTLAGFILMTINLVSGIVSSISNYGQMMVFSHHIVLSIIAWLCFGSLVFGRKIAGWRGEIAAKWTIGAFIILMLAYFGTRFVNDIILGK